MSLIDTPLSDAASRAATRRSGVRWSIFGVVFLLVTLNMVDRTALSIAMPTIGREFALSPTEQGVLLSAFFWSYAVLQIPGGWLIDRFGPRRLVAAATLLWGLFQALAALATSGPALLVTRVGLGAAEAPLYPSGAKLSAAWLAPQERGRGAVLMDSGSPLGAAFGGVAISALILLFDSWRAAFAVAGVATMLVGIAAWHYLRDDPAVHSGVNAAELAHIRGADAPVRAQVNAGTPDRIRSWSLVGLLGGRMGWAMINFGLLTWGPSYLVQARHFDLKAIGSSTFIIFLSGMAGSLVAGFAADAAVSRGWSRPLVYKGMLTVSGLATLASFLVLPRVADPVAAVAVLSATLFFLYWGSLYWSLPALLAPRSAVGVVSGLMNCAGSVSGIAVPILTGAILQATGTYGAVLGFFALCAGLYVLGTLLIAFPRPSAGMQAR